MGGQVSITKMAVSREGRKKRNKSEKGEIGILSFEVANLMSKIMLLWQSISDHEIVRLRTDVIKAEGILNLVSDSEAVLLSLACMEKIQDLTAVAGAVSRLGKKCQEPMLQHFEYVYNDVLQRKVDVSGWEFSLRDMDGKVKKMEQLIASTSNLKQELEILRDVEVATQRMHDDGSGTPSDREMLLALEEKAGWHRQQVKYLRNSSLWNCPHDKIVNLLARNVCTIHGKIVTIFGSPLLGLSQLFPVERLRDIHASPLKTGVSPFIKMTPKSPLGGLERQSPAVPVIAGPFTSGSHDHTFLNSAVISVVSTSRVSRVSPVLPDVQLPNRQFLSSGSLMGQTENPNACYIPLYRNRLYSPTRGSMNLQAISYDNAFDNPAGSSSKVGTGTPWSNFADPHGAFFSASQPRTSFRIPRPDSRGKLSQTGLTRDILFDPKNRHHNAPSSTLGGAALALHYANVVIMMEKMIKFPHLVSLESTDDLYHMLPKSVRMALRSRLKSVMKMGRNGFDSDIARDWKDALERILAWLTPLAHSMIRWQSEHSFDQQRVEVRSNILLLQTLYFADLVKSEAAITELLVGLNYICGHEKEKTANMSTVDSDNPSKGKEYLEWHL